MILFFGYFFFIHSIDLLSVLLCKMEDTQMKHYDVLPFIQINIFLAIAVFGFDYYNPGSEMFMCRHFI